MKTRLACIAAILFMTACNIPPACDTIKVGDTIEEKTANCFSSPFYGGLPIQGTCNDTGKWTCAVAGRGFNAYAASCPSSAALHCMVQLDSAGKVGCVKQFCQD